MPALNPLSVYLRAGLVIGALGAALAMAASQAQAREYVASPDLNYRAGTIVVRTSERRLYFITAPGTAIRYTVGVGKAGKQWTGTKYVEELAVEPAWSPPASVKRERPHLPNLIPPGPRNPMGARVIGLGPGGEYAIHGTNEPSSVGRFVSFGCIRMHNADVIDLFARVRMGTPVVVNP
ncbi:MAG: L,D-transpeptidase [Beijerinckiaceae bacterium]